MTAQGAAVLEGRATCRERFPLPPGARLVAVLEDVTRDQVPAPVLGAVTVDPAGHLSIPFRIAYDPARVLPGHRYAVAARLMLGDAIVCLTTRQYVVTLPGAGASLELLLERFRAQAGLPGNP